jgi:hypothetical protein
MKMEILFDNPLHFRYTIVSDESFKFYINNINPPAFPLPKSYHNPYCLKGYVLNGGFVCSAKSRCDGRTKLFGPFHEFCKSKQSWVFLIRFCSVRYLLLVFLFKKSIDSERSIYRASCSERPDDYCPFSKDLLIGQIIRNYNWRFFLNFA